MMGYTSTNVPDDADVLFFNTCAIRKAAEDRVLSDVNKLRYLKISAQQRYFVSVVVWPKRKKQSNRFFLYHHM